jgi:hypothetical protein
MVSSLINQLPTELISECFACCHGESMERENTINLPLRLAAVCSHWRDIALSTPRLWHRIGLTLQTSKIQTQEQIVRQWLRRSGTHPLKAQIFWEEDRVPEPHPALTELIRASDRWEEMAFYIPLPVFAVFAGIQDKLPLLSELTLVNTAGGASFSHLKMFSNCPRLHMIQAANFIVTRAFILPWHQIRTIGGLSGTVEELIGILKQSTSLEYAQLFPESSGGLQHVMTPTVLPRLTTLTIPSLPWVFPVLMPLLEPFAFPNLGQLTLGDFPIPSPSSLPQFLSRSPRLKYLVLQRTVIKDEHLLECLLSVPSLESIVVEERRQLGMPSPLSHHFFSQMSQKRGDTYIAPHLLYFKAQLTNPPSHELLDMLEHRSTPREGQYRPLRMISLFSRESPSYPVLDRLKALEKSGVEVKWSHEV